MRNNLPRPISSQSLAVLVYPVEPTIELSFQDGTTKTITLSSARWLVESLEEVIEDFERKNQANAGQR